MIKLHTRVEEAAAKDEPKALHGVYYDADNKVVVATNGYILAIVPVDADDNDQSGIIPYDVVKESQKAAGRKNPAVFDMSEAGNGTVSFPGKVGKVICDTQDGTFPKYQQIVPEEKHDYTETVPDRKEREQLGTVTITFNVNLLADLAKAMGVKGQIHMTIDLGDVNRPFLVKPGMGANEPRAIGAIMPMIKGYKSK